MEAAPQNKELSKITHLEKPILGNIKLNNFNEISITNNRNNIPLPKKNNKNINFVESELPPEGFQNIEEEKNIFELFYNGKTIGIYFGEKINNKIYFNNIEKIINEIDAYSPIKNKNKVLLNISNNGITTKKIKCQKNCYDDNIIYILEKNENYHIYINPETVENTDNNYYFPESTGDISLINYINGFYNKNNNNEFYNINNETILSKGNHRMVTNWNINKNTNTISEGYYETDTNLLLIKSGIINSQGHSPQNIYNSPKILGLSLENNYNKFQTKNKFIEPIFINLESRSQVEIYKDNKLFHSSEYSSGVNKIYVGTLPNGGYNLNIIITDSVTGEQTTKTIFYSKNSFLPTKGKPLYYIDIGQSYKQEQKSTLPELTNNNYFRIGEKRRLYKNLGTYNEISYYNEDSYYSTSLFFISNILNTSLSYYKSDNNNEGSVLNLNSQTSKNSSLNVYFKKEKIEESTYEINKPLNLEKLESENIGINFNQNLKN